MYTIVSLFARSPFAPLQAHMEKVSLCVHQLPDLFDALDKQDYAQVEKIASSISEMEHMADLMKNDIRNHLPKNIYLPVDRGNLLEILGIQDTIADASEDIAVLLTLKQLQMPLTFRKDFREFLDKNMACFESARNIMKEMYDLLESSFGGVEAEKVRSMINDVAYKEHEADIIQRQLLKKLFSSENELNYITFDLWQKIFEKLASVSNLSEKLAHRVRMTLDLK